MSKKTNKTLLIGAGVIIAGVVIYAMTKKSTTTTTVTTPVIPPTGGTNLLTQGESLLTSLLGKSSAAGGTNAFSSLWNNLFGSSTSGANTPSGGFTAGDPTNYTSPSNPFTPPDLGTGNYLDYTGDGDTSVLA